MLWGSYLCLLSNGNDDSQYSNEAEVIITVFWFLRISYVGVLCVDIVSPLPQCPNPTSPILPQLLTSAAFTSQVETWATTPNSISVSLCIHKPSQANDTNYFSFHLKNPRTSPHRCKYLSFPIHL